MAEAVRYAMLETRRRHPHPYYWAPFVLMGRFRDS
jgi:CHAT domain-containing protein